MITPTNKILFSVSHRCEDVTYCKASMEIAAPRGNITVQFNQITLSNIHRLLIYRRHLLLFVNIGKMADLLLLMTTGKLIVNA